MLATHHKSHEAQTPFVMELCVLVSKVLIVALIASISFAILVLAVTQFNVASAAGARRAQEEGGLYFNTQAGRVNAVALASHADISVSGPLARIRVTQKFRNDSDQWVEGIYVFPLPENAAVDQLRMRIGDRVIEGEIHERDAAKKIYEQARDSGQKTALLEQERSNLFTTSVANVGPGQEITVEIGYRQTVDYAVVNGEGRFSLRYPVVVGPRYIPGEPVGKGSPGWSVDTDQVSDASRITPPVATDAAQAAQQFSLSVNLDAGVPIDRVRSDSHDVDIVGTGDSRRRITLSGDTLMRLRDFELIWTVKAQSAPQTALFTEQDDERVYALLMIVPPAQQTDVRPIPRELVFVIDTSGSMYGDSMVQAREAVKMALQNLTPQDSFNVIEFNDSARPMYLKAQKANAENIRSAQQWVGALQANGGTEIYAALKMALDGGVHSDRVRQVVFLTDGSVGNEEALFDLIAQRLGDSRLFTVGIGSAPNSYFMRKAAQYGKGTFTYIGQVDEVQTRMGELLDKIQAPALRGINVSWGHVQVEAWPRNIPDLYQGEPLVMVAAFPPGQNPAQSEITASGSNTLIRWEKKLSVQQASAASGLGALWARNKIDALMDNLREGADEEAVRTEVIALAMMHRLMTRYTSFVAVEQKISRPREDALDSEMLATPLPEGWDEQAVFGELPQGATASRVQILGGLLGMVLCAAMLSWRRGNRRDGIGRNNRMAL